MQFGSPSVSDINNCFNKQTLFLNLGTYMRVFACRNKNYRLEKLPSTKPTA